MSDKFTPKSKRREKVTKYLDLQLNVLRILGLFKLADSKLSHPYRYLLQKIYIRFTFTFSAILLTSGYLCILLRASKDFIEVFKILVETIVITSLLCETLMLMGRNSQLLKLLDLINKFDVTSNRSLFNTARKLEALTLLMYGLLVGFSTLSKYVEPFLSINDKEYAHRQYVYGFKNPRNKLPMCLWIPKIDTSELKWFPLIYIIEMYSAILWNSLAITTALFYPFILLHFCTQYLILSRQLKSLGQTTLLLPPSRYLGYDHDRLKRNTEILQMKKCIVFHRRLVDFRLLFNSVMDKTIGIRIILILMATSFSAYPMTLISRFEHRDQALIVAEFILTLSFYYYNCLMSETLDWSNSLLRQSIYQNKWYNMCPEARRMLLMLMRQTQRPHHMKTLGGMVVLGNVNFMKTLKVIYTFIRFVNLTK
ncbi:hypothetical protein WDU94_012830 [Cyamophila willieti]